MPRTRAHTVATAIAWLLLAVAAPSTASAQTAPPAPPTPVRTTADSVVFIRITPSSARANVISQERLDSLHIVLRQMETQAVGSRDWVELQNRVTAIMSDLREQAPMAGRMTPSPSRELTPGVYTFGEGRLLRDPIPTPRGWIGLNIDGPHDVTLTGDGEAVHYFEYPLVVSVDPNSPADRSGISSGDLLMAYDGADVRQSWINMTRLLQPDRKITVTVKRDGQTKRYHVTVDSAPAGFVRRLAIPLPAPNLRYSFTPAVPGALLPSMVATNALFGATMSDVTQELASALSLSAGVLVNAAPPESPAYKGGLRVGDVVTSAGGVRVASVNQFRHAVAAHADDRQLVLEVRRKGQSRQLTLRW